VPKEVKSSDIYWGSIPWVLLQLVMVLLVIFFPKIVTITLDAPSSVDPNKVKIELQAPSDDEPPPIVIPPAKN
jgi:hypothetical protein